MSVAPEAPAVPQPRWRRRARAVAIALIIVGGVYYVAAYFVLPALWSHHEHEPGLAGRPMVTVTAQGIPGDPLDVGLVGSRREAVTALRLAGWYPADAITLATSVEIAGSVLFDRPFRDAPVSPLFYDGRKEDLAFEKPVGASADRRNHVRFWLVLEKGKDGRPVWLGSATFDRGVGLSRYTGEITHHIGPDVDAVRDLLIADLTKARMLMETYQVSGVSPTLNGRNGGGDPYYTDGEITVGVLSLDAEAQTAAPVALPNPPAVAAKDAVWAKLKGLLRRVEP